MEVVLESRGEVKRSPVSLPAGVGKPPPLITCPVLLGEQVIKSSSFSERFFLLLVCFSPRYTTSSFSSSFMCGHLEMAKRLSLPPRCSSLQAPCLCRSTSQVRRHKSSVRLLCCVLYLGRSFSGGIEKTSKHRSLCCFFIHFCCDSLSVMAT